jgi:hypothetical protein
MHPRFELCLSGLPARGVLPDTEKDFLCDVLGFGCVAEHAPGEADHAGKVTANDLGRRAPVTSADTPNQFLVWVPHGLRANSAQRRTVTNGKMLNNQPLSTLCIQSPHLPSVSCSRSRQRLQLELSSAC